MVKDRFDCDCARALKALLAWWLPDRSIVFLCMEEWRWSQREEEGGKERIRAGLHFRRRYFLLVWRIERPKTSSPTRGTSMASGRSGNKLRMKSQAGPSGSRRTRLQFILFQRTRVRRFESLWGTGLELGEGSGSVGDEWEELASEIAHLQSLTSAAAQAIAPCGLARGGRSGRWMTQIGIFSRGQLRGRKGPGHTCHRLHSPDLASLVAARCQ